MGEFDGWATCTLEAGVKIYSVRVDAVHAEAYKVLSGINRVGQEDVHEMHSEGGNVNNSMEGCHTRKNLRRRSHHCQHWSGQAQSLVYLVASSPPILTVWVK
ncbi:hypothetical protein SLE2022_397550 [Rubroshorea leprosula]